VKTQAFECRKTGQAERHHQKNHRENSEKAKQKGRKEEKAREEGKDEKDNDEPGLKCFSALAQFVNPRHERFRDRMF